MLFDSAQTHPCDGPGKAQARYQFSMRILVGSMPSDRHRLSAKCIIDSQGQRCGLLGRRSKNSPKTKMAIPRLASSDPETRLLKAKNILEKTARKIPTCVTCSSPLTPNKSFSSWPRYRSNNETRIMAEIEPTKNQAVISDW